MRGPHTRHLLLQALVTLAIAAPARSPTLSRPGFTNASRPNERDASSQTTYHRQIATQLISSGTTGFSTRYSSTVSTDDGDITGGRADINLPADLPRPWPAGSGPLSSLADPA